MSAAEEETRAAAFRAEQRARRRAKRAAERGLHGDNAARRALQVKTDALRLVDRHGVPRLGYEDEASC